MPLLPPIVPPSDDINNLGPDKRDLDKAPNDTDYFKASEWNWAKSYIKWLYDAYNSLALTGSLGTLWDAYTNHGKGTNFNPARVYMDANNGSVIFTDASTPIGKLLLGVSARTGANEYGFWAQGLRLPDSADGIHTQNRAIRMRSGQALSSEPAYRLDTTNPFGISQKLLELRSAGSDNYSFLAGGTLVAHNILSGTTQWSIVPLYDSTGAIAFASAQTGGVSLLPQATAVGTLGRSSTPWLGIHARYHATSRATSSYAAFKTYDLNNGEWQEVTLTGDMSIVGISNAQIGAIMSLMFIQGGTGGYVLGYPADIKVNRAFRLSPGVGDVDVLTIRYDGFSWFEIGRFQTNAPEEKFEATTLTTGTLFLQAHKQGHTQEVQGTLSAPADIQIDPAFAVKGDKIEIIFDETNGVVTTTVNTLTVKIFGGGNLAVFNQNKTLRGRLLLYHTGTAWKVSMGAALSYV